MSDLYNSPVDVAPVTRARSADLNTIDAAVGAAFDKLPDEMVIKKNTITFAINGGSSGTAYVASRPGITSYTDGMEVVLRAGVENTGPATLNVNGLGAIAMKRADGVAVQAKDIQQHAVLSLRFSQELNAFILPPVVGSQIALAQQAVVDAQQKVVDAQAQVTLAANQVTLASNQVTIAAGHASNASTSASNAAGSASAASTSAGNASGSATAASGSATLASNWAQLVGAAVTTGSYSAREWAVGTFTRGIAGGGSAKDWANLVGSTVDGTNYSARHWAQIASSYSLPFGDSVALLKNTADQTRQARFLLSSIDAGTLRTYTVPNKDGTMALLSDFLISKEFVSADHSFTANGSLTVAHGLGAMPKFVMWFGRDTVTGRIYPLLLVRQVASTGDPGTGGTVSYDNTNIYIQFASNTPGVPNGVYFLKAYV